MLSAPTHTPEGWRGGDPPNPTSPSSPPAAGGASPPLRENPDILLHVPRAVCLWAEKGCWGSGCCSGDPQPLGGAGAAPPSLPPSLPPPLLANGAAQRVRREGGRREKRRREEGGDLPIWLYLLRCLSHAPGGRCGSPRPAERGRLHPAGAARRAGGCPRPSASTPPPPPLRPLGAFIILFRLGFILVRFLFLFYLTLQREKKLYIDIYIFKKSRRCLHRPPRGWRG